MMRNTLAKFCRRWRSQYRDFSSASPKDVLPIPVMEKCADVLTILGKQAAMAAAGYAFSAFFNTPNPELLEYEKFLIREDESLDKRERMIEEFEEKIKEGRSIFFGTSNGDL